MKKNEEKHFKDISKDNKTSFIKKPRNIIILIVLIIILIGSGLFAYYYFSNILSDDEKMVSKIVQKYHDGLKNPSSMQIFEIRIYNNSQGDGKTILMDTAGQNGFGGNTRNIVAYTNEAKYMGNDSEANRTISKYTSSTDKLEIIVGKGIQDKWKDNKEYISIDTEKILRNYEKVK